MRRRLAIFLDECRKLKIKENHIFSDTASKIKSSNFGPTKIPNNFKDFLLIFYLKIFFYFFVLEVTNFTLS